MRNSRGKGITLVELLVTVAIVGILAAAVLPLTRNTVKRSKEMELRSNLRILRGAIDAFRKDCLPAGTPTSSTVKLSTEYCKADRDYYPESLELLTQPLTLAGAGDKTKKYLRRIPRDPMMPVSSPDDRNNWGLRSYKDEPDSTEWGGDNVFDVYSKSSAVALDGSKYSTW